MFNESDEGNTKSLIYKNNKIRCPKLCKRSDIDDTLKHTTHGNDTKDSVEIRERFSEKTIDKICITIFPLSFAIFNIIYWHTFL